jgi:hypothetical protein
MFKVKYFSSWVYFQMQSTCVTGSFVHAIELRCLCKLLKQQRLLYERPFAGWGLPLPPHTLLLTEEGHMGVDKIMEILRN